MVKCFRKNGLDRSQNIWGGVNRVSLLCRFQLPVARILDYQSSPTRRTRLTFTKSRDGQERNSRAVLLLWGSKLKGSISVSIRFSSVPLLQSPPFYQRVIVLVITFTTTYSRDKNIDQQQKMGPIPIARGHFSGSRWVDVSENCTSYDTWHLWRRACEHPTEQLRSTIAIISKDLMVPK